MRFAANAENIRTEGHKHIRTKVLQDIWAWTCVQVPSRTEGLRRSVYCYCFLVYEDQGLDGVALMFLRANGRKSMPVCLEALLFLCSYVLMFFRVSGKSHSFTHNYMPVCVMPDARRVAPISACVSFLTSSLSCAIT